MTSSVRFPPTWLALSTVLLVFLLQQVQGHPVSTTPKRFSTGFGTEDVEIEISPYVFKEFSKKFPKSPERIIMVPPPTRSVPPPYAMQFSPNHSSEPVVFEDDVIMITKGSDIERMRNPINKDKDDKRNATYHVSEDPKIKKNVNSNDTYVQRFLSKNVSINECPTGHVYSKLQKRCMRKYSLVDSSILG